MNDTPASHKLAQVLGTLPTAKPDDLVIFTCCDSVYFAHHVIPLVYSIETNAPGSIVHVHVVNPEPGVEPLLTVIDIDTPNTRLSATYENVEFPNADEIAKRTYYASIRFVRQRQMLETVPAKYLAIDADSLVRRDLGFIRAIDADLGVIIDKDMPEHMRVKAGAVLLQPRDQSKLFAAYLAENIAAQFVAGNAPWFLDQIVLFKVLEAMPPPFQVHRFDASVMDWEFAKGSAIWTGKGPRKHDNETYLAAHREYAEMNEIGAMQARFWGEAA